MKALKIAPLALTSLFVSPPFAPTGFAADGKKTRDEMVIGDRESLQGDAEWIYNDFGRAKEAAAAAGKPLMVVFRCIP